MSHSIWLESLESLVTEAIWQQSTPRVTFSPSTRLLICPGIDMEVNDKWRPCIYYFSGSYFHSIYHMKYMTTIEWLLSKIYGSSLCTLSMMCALNCIRACGKLFRMSQYSVGRNWLCGLGVICLIANTFEYVMSPHHTTNIRIKMWVFLFQ